MSLPIKLISTDFDGTMFAEFENPPVPAALLELIGSLQARGAKWVINTGRDMSGVMEALGRSHFTIKPDFLVIVEREIHCHKDSQYVSHADWNLACHRDHEELFVRVRRDLPRLVSWVHSQYDATIYEDAFSPFCLIAGNNAEADAIHQYMDEYCKEVPNLMVMRNDVYARFCHSGYNKGSALAEIGRLLEVRPEETLAAGDHLNDLPMLLKQYAGCLVAPSNAIDVVKTLVLSQGGFVSELPQGKGLLDGLKFYLNRAGA